MLSYEEIYKIAEKRLSEKRFYHSKCVVERCVEYGEKYGIDVEKLKIAGIVHDIAKEFPEDRIVKVAEEYGVELDEFEKENLFLVHSKLGAVIAEREFGCSEDIVEAIRWHTTGRENMSILEKILFLADKSGKDRTYFDTEKIREMVKENIDDALIEMLKTSIENVLNHDMVVHPDSIITYNYLIRNRDL